MAAADLSVGAGAPSDKYVIGQTEDITKFYKFGKQLGAGNVGLCVGFFLRVFRETKYLGSGPTRCVFTNPFSLPDLSARPLHAQQASTAPLTWVMRSTSRTGLPLPSRK